MIVHLSPNDKFIRQYWNFIEEYFEKETHNIFLFGKKPSDDYSGLINNNNHVLNIVKLFYYLIKADMIILHGLFGYKVFLLLLFPTLASKSSWLIWGGDLYDLLEGNSLLKVFKKRRISKLRYCATQIQKDIENVRLINPKIVVKDSFLYPSNIPYFSKDIEYPNRGINSIIVGNSADPSNNIIEVFTQLKEMNFTGKVSAILSYGSSEYATRVKKIGVEFFGSSFCPLNEFLPRESFFEYLNSFDAAIYYHRRQQAVGNITQMLALGKVVITQKEHPVRETYEKLGFVFHDVIDVVKGEFSIKDLEMNSILAQNHFNEQRLFNQMQDIFNSCIR